MIAVVADVHARADTARAVAMARIARADNTLPVSCPALRAARRAAARTNRHAAAARRAAARLRADIDPATWRHGRAWGLVRVAAAEAAAVAAARWHGWRAFRAAGARCARR